MVHGACGQAGRKIGDKRFASFCQRSIDANKIADFSGTLRTYNQASVLSGYSQAKAN
jgi:hypothetical protein